MISIGLTGGIGSGKSTVAKVFVAMGIPVYNSDVRAKLLMVKNQEVILAIKNLFGNDIYIDNKLDKQKLANIVFTDISKLAQLNKIVHPAVAKDFETWAKQQTSAIVLKEAAILFEIGAYKHLDYNILVTAPKEERINRTIARDNTTKTEVLARMKNQWEDEQKIPLADFIIDNSGEELVIPQVLEIVKRLNL
jgi:dephospho-CoA kinase